MSYLQAGELEGEELNTSHPPEGLSFFSPISPTSPC